MPKKPLTVAWISDFPIEWMRDLPAALRALPRRHPATWQMVLLEEFRKNPSLNLHVILLRHRLRNSCEFSLPVLPEFPGSVTFHVLKASAAARVGSLFWLDTMLIARLCRRLKPGLVHAWGNEKGAGIIAKRLGYPWLLTIQGLYSWYRERVDMAAYDRLMGRFERASLKRARVVTTESRFSVKYLQERYPKLRIVQAEHAPNRVFAQVQRNPAPKPLHFISIGTLGFRKGTDLLFAALEQLRAELDFKLTIISNPDPAYLQQMRHRASPELWSRVDFKHHILPNEVAAELVTPAMLLLPTRADTSPNAVKEAVVAGVPVVAANVGGIPDYVIPGENGMLFEPADLKGFIEAIRKACAHELLGKGKVNPSTLKQMREYLSPEVMAKNFQQAYALFDPQ